MDEDGKTKLFFELFSGLPRQGPGDDRSTLRALALVPGVRQETRVLDLGCGTGSQTIALARNSAARVVAIDSHPPFVAELTRRAKVLGLEDRIDGRVSDMTELDFPDASFELLWCEGAIYVIGFERGLREWRRLLVPGGHMAITEVCWTKPDPPTELKAFWAEQYPAIREVPALVAAISECGYDTVGHFPLPRTSWWEEYYGPLQRNIEEFRDRHRGEAEAKELADEAQREIDIWRAYSEFYGYEFFVIRAASRL
jgi:ubiquinone/menaquinone biosynthesis C-methylase UbiE